MKKITARMTADEKLAYVVKWISKKPFGEFKPQIDEINFYDEEAGEDVTIPVETALQFSTQKSKDKKDVYIVTFDGSINFSLSPDQLKTLKDRGCSVDYCVSFVSKNGEIAETGDDYELVENRNVPLELK